MQITFDDDKTLADFNMVVLKGYEKSLIPSISSNTTTIPGRVGVWDNGDELGQSTDVFGIACLSQSTIKRERYLREFHRYITDDFGKPRELKIVLSDEPHLFFMAKLFKSKAPKRYNSGADFELALISSGPRRYSRFANDEVVWGSKKINFIFSYELGHVGLRNEIKISSVTNISIKVDGYNVRPTIRLVGTGTNITISNKNQVIKLPKLTNSSIVIDCKKYTIDTNGTIGFVDFDDFILFHGENNVSIQGDDLNFKISIEYRDEY